MTKTKEEIINLSVDENISSNVLQQCIPEEQELTQDSMTISGENVDLGSPEQHDVMYYKKLAENPFSRKYDSKIDLPPVDGIRLNELREKPVSEILSIANEMGSTNNKSDARVMYAHGYAFTWTDLSTVAEYLGFEKISGNSLAVKYKCENQEEDSEVIVISRSKREGTAYVRISMEQETKKIMESFWKMLPINLGNIDKSKVVNEVLRRGFKTLVSKSKEGKKTIYKPKLIDDSFYY